MWKWILIKENCTGCGICYDVCEYEAIVISTQMAYPEGIDGKCSGCGKCIAECPFGAIELGTTDQDDL